MSLKLKEFYFFTILFFYSTLSFGQLGFCNGSSGAPIFFENFGSGTNYGPSLPVGVTNYTYVNSGFPNDGQYTLYYRTNLIPNSPNWMYSLDHTPDTEPDGVNGKCLIVNADINPSQFYKRTVTGLCSNTTFEFSAWVLNILNATTNQSPINVTFEIWDATDTILLKSGSTGIIANTFTPIWNQYGLVFTMPAGQTSVILKMRNNFNGGLGNDLAIDDIMFRACGEYSTITNTGNTTNSISICENETITNNQLQVTTIGTASNVYQWQQSNDNVNFTDIAGETNTIYIIPTLNTTTYYRVKVANDIANLSNPFCSTLSDIFTVIINALPNPPVSSGNLSLCSNQSTSLSVSVNANQSVNWYDAATNGNLLQANSSTYSPTNAGTYYAEAYNLSTGCISSTRTAATLLPLTTISYSGNTTICSSETSAISLTASNTNAILNWTATSSDVTGFSNGTGNTISQTLTYSGTTSGTVIYTVIPVVNGCEGTAETIVITVNPLETIALVFPLITTTYCINATPEILPSASSNTTPVSGTWDPLVINTTTSGTTTYTFRPLVGSCQNILPYQINITVGNNFSPDFPSTISFCAGETPPILSSTSPNGITGTWSPAVIDNLVSGSYTFTPNLGSCANQQTINTLVLQSTLTSITYSLTSAFTENQTITIIASQSGNYYYQLDNGPIQESNIFENVSLGNHTITVLDQNGCGNYISEDILVINYPNYFTPNDDGINDFWTIVGMDSFENWKITIFDRYGKLITQLSESNLFWDGRYNGNQLPSSDYWFFINYKEDNVNKKFSANFSLIR